ncbi:MAG: hypothetical protein NTNFB01_03420 [Nitrospira sp.]|jgi:Ser/Thr protein kinase RdoA (MazF antagonist)
MANSPARIKAIGALLGRLIETLRDSAWPADEAPGRESWPLLGSGATRHSRPATTDVRRKVVRIA